MFDDIKVSQLTMFFAHKEGGSIEYLKLMKLLYLADRRAMKLYDYPLSDDSAVSMDKGPVLSNTYDLITGQTQSHYWVEHIDGLPDYQVGLKQSFNLDDLDELSAVDIEVLEAIWNEFGHMSKWQLVDHTHDNCPEWQDPQGTSYPISPSSIYQALGNSPDDVDRLNRQYFDRKQLKELHSNYQ